MTRCSICQQCGVEFVCDRKRKYCTNKCNTKAYRERHPNKIKDQQKRYKENNRKKISDNIRQWRDNNPEKLKEYSLQRKEKNRRYWNKRRKDDFVFRMKNNLRNRLNIFIKNINSSASITKLLGCDGSFLKKYLESKFTEGMSWKNYGKNGWHIDHIIPCSSFDFNDDEQLKKCWHYTNLQPLWAKDNLKKWCKVWK